MAMTINLRYRLELIKHRLGLDGSPELYYVAPGASWSLDWDGHYITRDMKARHGLPARVVHSASKLVGEIVHYGSLWGTVGNLGMRHNRDNLTVSTIFHGDPSIDSFDTPIQQVLDHLGELDRLHTASQIMEARFLEWGISREKIVRIPLGVDLQIFKPHDKDTQRKKRLELGIPEDVFCIGSFQKDGAGMDDGVEPKHIKGPDVLLDVIQRLHADYPIFVLLSAPARGYVKRGLEALGVPYRHVVEDDYERIPQLFAAIDAYLLTSREEGGPKGVLEALASGVPFVGTRVGLVPDVVTQGRDGFYTESEDVDGLAELVARLIDDRGLGHSLARAGLETIQDYDWTLIADRYYQEIYRPLLDQA